MLKGTVVVELHFVSVSRFSISFQVAGFFPVINLNLFYTADNKSFLKIFS